MTKILITGGAGFIGTNLVLKLSQDLNNHIRVIDNLWRGNPKYIENIENIEFIKGDLTDCNLCLKYIRDVDVVYHLAEIVSGVDYAFKNQSFIFRQNILINSNVLHACLQNKIKNYIYVGSACCYPKQKQHQSGLNYFKEEDIHPLTPETSYGMSKYLGEYEAELVSPENDINIGILRLHNVYGPYCSFDDKTSQVIPALVKKTMQTNQELEIWGSGKQYRDFIYVDDVVEALLLMKEKGMNQGVIQVGIGIPVTIREIAIKLLEINDKSHIKLKFNLDKPEGDFGRLAIIDKANKILGWKPKISIEEGLKRLSSFYNNHIC